MRRLHTWAVLSLLGVLPLGCAALFTPSSSDWKVPGGPDACRSLCAAWNLQFAGMVGVGDQKPWGDGATACICQVPGAAAVSPAAAATAASLAAPVVEARKEEERRRKQRQQEEEEEREKRRKEQEEEEQKKKDSAL